MRDDASEITVGVEDDAVGTRRAAVVRFEVVHDGVLLIGPRDRKREALVVVIAVRD